MQKENHFVALFSFVLFNLISTTKLVFAECDLLILMYSAIMTLKHLLIESYKNEED
jgi:hypothetical protein